MKKIVFQIIGAAITLIIKSSAGLKWFNKKYESATQRWVNVYHQYVRFPKRSFEWNIRLKNGHQVIAQVNKDDYKTLQFAIDYTWYSPGIAIVENEISNFYKQDCLNVDVGANLGMRSLFALSQNQRTIMFEPNDEVSNINQARCELNGFSNFELIRKGISSSSGEVSFSIDTSSYKSSINPTSDTEVSETVTIQTISLDDWYKAQQSLPSNIYVKVDIEGHERELVEGAKQFIKELNPTFVIEINEKGKNFDEIFKHFQNEGYYCASLDAGKWNGHIVQELMSGNDPIIETVTDFIFTCNRELLDQLVDKKS